MWWEAGASMAASDPLHGTKGELVCRGRRRNKEACRELHKSLSCKVRAGQERVRQEEIDRETHTQRQK